MRLRLRGGTEHRLLANHRDAAADAEHGGLVVHGRHGRDIHSVGLLVIEQLLVAAVGRGDAVFSGKIPRLFKAVAAHRADRTVVNELHGIYEFHGDFAGTKDSKTEHINHLLRL